jgi:ComF family protein
MRRGMLAGGGMFPVGIARVNEKGLRMSTIDWMSRRAPFGVRMCALAASGRTCCALARGFASAALPPVCCLCGAPGQAPDLDLCDVCATLLPVLDSAGTPVGAAGERTLVRTLFLFKYQYPIDHLIRALKFRGERVFARVLGTLMARAHRELGWELPRLVVPMPLHVGRYRERGFNQAHEIARFAVNSLNAGRLSTGPCKVSVDSRLLVRASATREQSGLSLEERHKNVRGAFEVVAPVPRGRIALVDDVVTTGSTAMAAAHALLAAGAEEIELWAAARVERDF